MQRKIILSYTDVSSPGEFLQTNQDIEKLLNNLNDDIEISDIVIKENNIYIKNKHIRKTYNVCWIINCIIFIILLLLDRCKYIYRFLQSKK